MNKWHIIKIQRSGVALRVVLNTVLVNLEKTSPILTEIIISLFHSYYYYPESSTAEQCTGFSLCKAFWLLSVGPKFHHQTLVHTELCHYPQNMLALSKWLHINRLNCDKDDEIWFSTPLNTRYSKKIWDICTLKTTLFSVKSMTYLLKADIQQPSVYYNIYFQKSLSQR